MHTNIKLMSYPYHYSQKTKGLIEYILNWCHYWTDPKNLGGPIDLLSYFRPSVRTSGWIPLERLHSFF